MNYYLDTKLVRGLDYYTRTVFEIFLDKGEGSESQSLALAAGGRYDPLAKILGKRDIPAVGGGIGGGPGGNGYARKENRAQTKENAESFFDPA